MWKRRELKSRAKKALRANYWRCVLAALLIACISGSGVSIIAGSLGAASGGAVAQTVTEDVSSETTKDPVQDLIGVIREDEDLNAAFEELNQLGVNPVYVLLSLVAGVIAVVFVISLLVKILLINPIDVGCHYFFSHNSKEKARVGDLAEGFECGYGRVVKTMFLTNLFLCFWTLLFIIPGIIKSYSYRMVPYILADQPDLGGLAAIKRSRQMMKGNKWRSFVLDLSFILWYILSALTLGIVGFFYVKPYVASTNAELYHALKDMDSRPNMDSTMLAEESYPEQDEVDGPDEPEGGNEYDDSENA